MREVYVGKQSVVDLIRGAGGSVFYGLPSQQQVIELLAPEFARSGYDVEDVLVQETLKPPRIVVVADATKWGVRGFSCFGTLDQAHVVISDTRLPEEAKAVLQEHVGELVLVPAGRPGRLRAAKSGHERAS